jgi:hypothetical protein
MTENDTETAPEVETDGSGSVELQDPPADVPEDEAKGYAVYDRVLGQYVGGVVDSKPSATAARKLTNGRPAAVVRV